MDAENNQVIDGHKVNARVLGDNVELAFSDLINGKEYVAYFCGENSKPIFPEAAIDVHEYIFIAGRQNEMAVLVTKKDSAMSLFGVTLVLVLMLF